MSGPPPPPSLQRTEAARYALLRGLTASMRNHMVAQLQPIGLAAQVLERRLHDPQADLAVIGRDMHQVQGFARSAVAANLDMVSWLAPEPGARVDLQDGARECLDLLRGHFSLRGFHLRLDAGTGAPVARHALRAVLTAVLLALADATRPPAELVLQLDGLRLQVSVRQGSGSAGPAGQPPYRPLDWEEVQTLAQAEHVEMARSAGAVELRFAPA